MDFDATNAVSSARLVLSEKYPLHLQLLISKRKETLDMMGILDVSRVGYSQSGTTTWTKSVHERRICTNMECLGKYDLHTINHR